MLQLVLLPNVQYNVQSLRKNVYKKTASRQLSLALQDISNEIQRSFSYKMVYNMRIYLLTFRRNFSAKEWVATLEAKCGCYTHNTMQYTYVSNLQGNVILLSMFKLGTLIPQVFGYTLILNQCWESKDTKKFCKTLSRTPHPYLNAKAYICSLQAE